MKLFKLCALLLFVLVLWLAHIIIQMLKRPLFIKHVQIQILSSDQARVMVPKRKIYVVYHIFKGFNWKSIVSEQIQLIVSSGLYEALDALYICTSGTNEDFSKEDLPNSYDELSYTELELKTFLMDLNLPKIQFLYSTPNKYYENSTINALILFAQFLKQANEEANILYIHNKGCGFPKKESVQSREAMMYYNVQLWKSAVHSLETNKSDFAGIFLKDFFYSGNFWWAKSENMAKYPLIQNMKNRTRAECFLINFATTPIMCRNEMKEQGLSTKQYTFGCLRYLNQI